MKLKKIASLMLAGVMAVSMLAGCSNVSDKPEDPTDPIEPGINSVSAAVEARVAANIDPEKIPAYVHFKDSGDLDADLEYAVEYAGVLDVLPQYVACDKLTWVAGDLTDRLTAAVGDEDDGVDVANIGDVDVLLDAEEQNTYEIDDEVAVNMYAISSAIGENAVNQMVAEVLDDIVVDYQYSTRNTTGGNGGNYNHEYTVSISTYTKAVNSTGIGGVIGGTVHGAPKAVASTIGVIGGGVSAENPAVTFVAIQVVRTSSHQ